MTLRTNLTGGYLSAATPLFNLAPNDGGKGGSGGTGGDDPPKGDTEGDDPPKPLGEEDIGKIVNSAVTHHLKRLNIPGQINDALGALKLDDKFKAITEALGSLKPSGDDPPKPGSKKGDGEPSDELKNMQRQFQKLTEQFESEKTARAAAEQAAREAEERHQFESGRQRLYESLKEHASPELHDVWVDHIVFKKQLKVEDGEPLLEVEYSPVKGMPKQKEFLPLAEALPHLLVSSDAKRFQAVPDPSNGGSPGPKRSARRGAANIESKDPQERVRARLEALGMDYDSEFA